MATIMVGVRFFDPDHLSWSAPIIGRSRGSLRSPLQNDDIVRSQRSCRLEVSRHAHIRGIGVGIELPIAASAGLTELRVKGKALESAFGSLRLDAYFPIGRGEIEIRGHGLAIGCDCKQ